MWIPRDADQIRRAALAGELPETPSFDAKAELPPSRKNADIATDVAAMATDGGVLLYGVGEDDHGQPTIPCPIPLGGAADRIGQVVATSIAEVPYIDVREYPTAEDPAVGYLVVIVPQSARAPHQVTVGGDLRFYGRGAKGNRRLTEGEVARLYERRQAWQVDREQVLRDVIAAAPIPPRKGAGYIHGFARPVVSDQSMLERAVSTLGGSRQMHQWLLNVVHSIKLRGQYGPSLESASFWRRYGADMWRLSTRGDEERSDPGDTTGLVDLNLNIDGRGQLFCGRATDARMSAPGQQVIIEVVIAGNIEALFAVMGKLYEAAGYHGQVDVGVAVTGIEGALSERDSRSFHPAPAYPVGTFARTDRVAARELLNPDEVGYRLLRHLFEATTGIDGWNPFTQPQNR
jgi:hypothetical protein